jgi:hypothetical protein
MEGEMKTTEMKPTTRLRYLLKDMENDLVLEKHQEIVLQQWWSNADSVKMGPVHMIKGEWRDVEVVDES